jgi:VanZ family protein
MRFLKLCFFCLILLVTALFVKFPFVANSANIKAWLDVVHLPLFFVFTLLVFGIVSKIRRFSRRKALGITLAGMFFFAFASEWLQGLTGRDASMSDAVNNLFGIGVAISLIFACWKKSLWWAVVCLLFLGFGSWISLTPVGDAMNAQRLQAERLPIIGDFEDDWEVLLWKPQGDVGGMETTTRRDDAWASKGTHSLRIDTFGAEWAGVFLLADPSDWSGYQELLFDCMEKGPKRVLGLRLDVKDGRRFTSEVSIESGENQCAVNFSNLRDSEGNPPLETLSTVVRLVLHGAEVGHKGTIFLDNVRLR